MLRTIPIRPAVAAAGDVANSLGRIDPWRARHTESLSWLACPCNRRNAESTGLTGLALAWPGTGPTARHHGKAKWPNGSLCRIRFATTPAKGSKQRSEQEQLAAAGWPWAVARPGLPQIRTWTH